MIETLKITIWDREFQLPVRYDCYKGEQILQSQISMVETLSKKAEWIEKAKKEVVKFCKKAVKEDATNTKKDNIFSYVKPVSVFVKHDDEKPRIALMCNYKYDMENGLAVVFTQKGKITVGLQDIIL